MKIKGLSFDAVNKEFLFFETAMQNCISAGKVLIDALLDGSL